ncbi:PTS ascorbate transporter subunit IIC [Mesomycoplasma lagogenitalium]|uniref:Ascorbate-specific PTS system EIIC component n=1 Tax=Mesomycoplasma lagogenitalium TaxID=171286 RepID=A0ABY8LV52_9BACT|nr:PTS ascorbate transporter subunit IIC [Mesomycoplasma lagogenitalium]WGI36403.1 PTS ascorbate transporter subunit IIC [Mesomycoplasma lagogenitalium]
MVNKINSKKKQKALIGWSIFAAVNLIIILVTLLVKAAVPKEGVDPWGSNAWLDAFLFLLNKVYLDNFLKQPALILGSLTLLGYLVVGRGIKDSLIGALKTIIGYLLLGIGSASLTGLAKPVFNEIKNLGQGVVPLDPYFSLASSNAFFGAGEGTSNIFSNSYVSLISFAFLAGFIVNIIMVALKKFTNTNSLMITGHVMLQQAAVVTTIFYIILFQDLRIFDGTINPGEQVGIIVMSGLFLGIYWAVGSSATLRGTNEVTQNSGFSIGHQQMLAIATTYKLGRLFGKKEDSAETKKLPSYLKIFEDNIFTQTVIISILFFILILILIIAKPDLLSKDWTSLKGELAVWNGTFGGANFVLNILGGAFKLVASLIAIMTGVRMFITELQQSFHGISEKVIPGAVVAVDVAAIYGFSINSVTFGFISGVIGQFLGVALMIGLAAIPGQNVVFVTIPLFITLFFNSGALGVYANASGGWKAAVILPGLIGLVEIIVVSFATKAISNTAGAFSPVDTGFIGMADWNLYFGILMWISSYHIVIAWILVPVTMIGLVVLAQIVDNGTQTKQTFLQKMLKLKTELVTN